MRTPTNTQETDRLKRSLFARLRALCPQRPLSLDEAKIVAERQANELLDWFGVSEAPVLTDLLTEMRRVRVVFEDSPASGSTHWTDGAWLIALRNRDQPTRQRFSMFHELKHVIDHPMRSYLYPPERGWSSARKAERVAEYFAACVLMPKRLVKRHYFEGEHNLDTLAAQFEVSPEAMHHRLQDDLRITEPPRQTYACRGRSAQSAVMPFVWRDRRTKNRDRTRGAGALR